MDEEMLQIISSANIAFGFHGGDLMVMHRTITLAKANGLGIGSNGDEVSPVVVIGINPFTSIGARFIWMIVV